MPEVRDLRSHLGGVMAGRVLRVTFSDDLVREIDFAGALPGVLAAVDDDTIFATAEVDPVARTVSWPSADERPPQSGAMGVRIMTRSKGDGERSAGAASSAARRRLWDRTVAIRGRR